MFNKKEISAKEGGFYLFVLLLGHNSLNLLGAKGKKCWIIPLPLSNRLLSKYKDWERGTEKWQMK